MTAREKLARAIVEAIARQVYVGNRDDIHDSVTVDGHVLFMEVARIVIEELDNPLKLSQ